MTGHSKYENEKRMLGLNIAFYRKACGMTQLEFAEALGISRTHISNIEAAKMRTSISLELLFDMCEVLGVSPADLLDFSRF